MIESTVYTMTKLEANQKIYSKMHDRCKTWYLPSKFAKNRVATIITVGDMSDTQQINCFSTDPGSIIIIRASYSLRVPLGPGGPSQPTSRGSWYGGCLSRAKAPFGVYVSDQGSRGQRNSFRSMA